MGEGDVTAAGTGKIRQNVWEIPIHQPQNAVFRHRLNLCHMAQGGVGDKAHPGQAIGIIQGAIRDPVILIRVDIQHEAGAFEFRDHFHHDAVQPLIGEIAAQIFHDRHVCIFQRGAHAAPHIPDGAQGGEVGDQQAAWFGHHKLHQEPRHLTQRWGIIQLCWARGLLLCSLWHGACFY